MYKALNAFPEPVLKEDAATVRRGLLSTAVFVIGGLVAFIAILASLSGAERTFQEVHTDMTYAKYKDLESKDPRCECTTADIAVINNNALAEALTSSANMPAVCSTSTGSCSLIAAARDKYSTWTPGASHNDWFVYALTPAAVQCEEYANAASRVIDEFKNTRIASSVMFSRDQFARYARTLLSSSQYLLADDAGRRSSTLIQAEMNGRPYVEAVNLCGLMPGTDNRCDCTSVTSIGCQFNYTVGGRNTQGLCDVSGLVYRLDIRTLSSALLSPTIDPSTYSTYAGTVGEFYKHCNTQIFNKAVAGLTIDAEAAYSGYFAQCAPKECSTIEKRVPTMSETLSQTLGLLAGVVTVFKVIALVVGMALVATVCKPKDGGALGTEGGGVA